MKNGHLPDHWQIWLWIGIAALILAAVARQYAIDIRGMSGFNANLIFLGVFVVFALLYLAFQEFISRTLGTALVNVLKSCSNGLASNNVSRKILNRYPLRKKSLKLRRPLPQSSRNNRSLQPRRHHRTVSSRSRLRHRRKLS